MKRLIQMEIGCGDVTCVNEHGVSCMGMEHVIDMCVLNVDMKSCSLSDKQWIVYSDGILINGMVM